MILAEEGKYCNIVFFQRLDGDVYTQPQMATDLDSLTCVVVYVSVHLHLLNETSQHPIFLYLF